MPKVRAVRAKVKRMTLGSISRMLAKQKKDAARQREDRAQVRRVKEALKAFKPRKSDGGKLVMVSGLGKRDPQIRGKRGFLVYVTKTGKKWLIRQKGQPLKPRKITQLTVPPVRMRKAAKAFQEKRRVIIEHQRKKFRSVVKGEGEITGEKTLVNDLTGAIHRALTRQESHRIFLITVLARVELPGGETKVYEAKIDIGRNDHVAIDKGGVRNFVQKKVWAFLATELSLDGLVSRESFNHVKRLSANRGRDREDWTNKRGDSWRGAFQSTVKITHIEWKIEQLKK